MTVIESVLPESDREYLDEKGYNYSVSRFGDEVHLVIQDFRLPPAYEPRIADLLIVIPAGYPQGNPDMFWTYPNVRLATGAWPKNADVPAPYGDRVWQRWSRHFPGGWRPGTDGIKSYLASIKRELDKGI